MRPFRTPNFRGWQALVLHREDENVARLLRQLERLGISATVAWPDCAGSPVPDVVFFDGDNAFDGLLPWKPNEAPMPLVALMGSEAPGRLEWALTQGAAAHLLKPVQSGGVFSALVIATSNFHQLRAMREQIAALKGQVRKRPTVLRAVLHVMTETGLDDEQAFRLIRSEAMRRRQSVERLCEALLRGSALGTPALAAAAARLRQG